MNFIDRAEIPSRDLFPGVHAKLIHTDRVTIAYVDLEEGAVVPAHSHVHEQIINMLEGTCLMTLGDETKTVTAPFTCVVPSNTVHAVTAITAGKIIDVFQPVREDLK